MRVHELALLVLIASSTRTPCATAQSLTGARKDTVDILDAVWRVATPNHQKSRVPWLYVPAKDTGVVTVSDAVRSALEQQGVAASARRPTGDDTVVFRVTRWKVDTGGTMLLRLNSHWTAVLGSGVRRCRTGSGNSENYRVARSGAGWSAVRLNPVFHGDNVCVSIP